MSDPNRLISPIARTITPYTAGEQPTDRRYIKLNTNESPYPPSLKAIAAIRERLGEPLRLYPPLGIEGIRAAAAKIHGLSPDMVFPANGSDEALAMAFMALFDPAEDLITPQLGYSFYPVYAQLYGLNLVSIPMLQDLRVDVEAINARTGAVAISNPNAPTSVALPAEAILSIVRAHPDHVVLVDEAYVMFGGQSVIPYIRQFDNLLVVRTLSKSHSLAGLRVGYALGQKHLIDALERIRHSFNSYPVDTLAQAGAAAALLDEEYAQDNCQKVMATRDRFLAALRTLGFEGPNSCSNFVFVCHPGMPGEVIFQKLREQGILVRRFNTPGIEDYLRISIGSPEDMDTVLSAVKRIVEQDSSI